MVKRQHQIDPLNLIFNSLVIVSCLLVIFIIWGIISGPDVVVPQIIFSIIFLLFGGMLFWAHMSENAIYKGNPIWAAIIFILGPIGLIPASIYYIKYKKLISKRSISKFSRNANIIMILILLIIYILSVIYFSPWYLLG